MADKVSFDPIARTIQIKDAKIFTDLLTFMMFGKYGSNLANAPQENSDLTIYQNLSGSIDKIVINLNLKGIDANDQEIVGSLVLKVNQKEDIIIPENIAEANITRDYLNMPTYSNEDAMGKQAL